ncbi:MAG: hypothetical protein ACYCX2_01840 [Christensenellales bacterium]
MKRNGLLFKMALVILVTLFCLSPLQSFAATADRIDEALVVVTVNPKTKDNTPPKEDISEDPNYGEGFSMEKTTVSGGCGITKNSSSSCTTSGYTSCFPSDPAVRVTLILQAYYDDAWHSLDSVFKSVSGTFVSESQGYSVTPGYYYRTRAIHSVADGTSAYSYSGSVYVG